MMLGRFITVGPYTINPERLDFVVWGRDEVDLYLAGREEPLTVGREDFTNGILLWRYVRDSSSPGRPQLRVVPADEEDAG
jgi:hypothetical protein